MLEGAGVLMGPAEFRIVIKRQPFYFVQVIYETDKSGTPMVSFPCLMWDEIYDEVSVFIWSRGRRELNRETIVLEKDLQLSMHWTN
jgi:hypothetical protein